MLTRPDDCRGCPLDQFAVGFTHPEGSGVNKVMLVGEAAGGHEAEDGLPFRPYAPAGYVLERAIKSLGYDRQQFSVSNILQCKPPGNELRNEWYEAPAIDHCAVHRNRVFSRFHPKIMVALGAIAFRTLTGMVGPIDQLQNFFVPAKDYPDTWVIGTWHPSYIQHGQWEVFPVLRLVLKRAVEAARTGVIPCNEEVKYIKEATPTDVFRLWERLMDQPQLTLSVDFETLGKPIIEDELFGFNDDDYSESIHVVKRKKKQKKQQYDFDRITHVNLSCEVGTAMSYDFRPEFQPLTAKILATENHKVGHNFWMFDQPVSEKNNMPVNGRIDDTIWMFHSLYPDLPGRKGRIGGEGGKEEGSLANLQFCASFYGFPWPWKHLMQSDLFFYGCCDADSDLRVYEGCKRELQIPRGGIEQGVWLYYEKMIYEIWPIVRDMGRRGIPVDREKLESFVREMRFRIGAKQREINPLIPEELRPVKQKHGLKKVPKDTEGLVQRTFTLLEPENCVCYRKRKVKCQTCLGNPKQNSLFMVGDECEECMGAGKVLRIESDPNCPHCGGKGQIVGDVVRWCQSLDFKPGAPKQLMRYARMKRHKIPRNSKKKIAMDKETLERMAQSTGDPVYSKCIEHRELTKMKSTYGEGWMPDDDGFVHSTFNFGPANGQLSSVRPNVQNAPHPVKHGELAHLFRDAIEAKPGKVLLELDYKSFHAQTLAFEAKDWDYLRLARLDIHSYLAGWMVKAPEIAKCLQFDDEKLKSYLKNIRKCYEKVRDKQAKPCILGYGFGMGATTLYEKNRDSFKDVKAAQYVIDVLDGAFPVCAEFRRQIPLIAKRQKFLMNAFGCIRWFFDVERWDFETRSWRHGKDWERTIAFLSQTDAFCHKKQAMKRVKDRGFDERFGMVNDIHDAFLFHCDEPLAEECLYEVRSEMQFPSEVLKMPDGSGFWCEVSLKRGPTWATTADCMLQRAA